MGFYGCALCIVVCGRVCSLSYVVTTHTTLILIMFLSRSFCYCFVEATKIDRMKE